MARIPVKNLSAAIQKASKALEPLAQTAKADLRVWEIYEETKDRLPKGRAVRGYSELHIMGGNRILQTTPAQLCREASFFTDYNWSLNSTDLGVAFSLDTLSSYRILACLVTLNDIYPVLLEAAKERRN